MRFALSLLSLGGAALMFAAPAFAADTYKLETPHTQVLFSINHMGYSNSWGKFTDYSGDITLDMDHPEKSSVTASIKTDSLQMNHDLWNEHVKAADLLDVAAYPDMTFKSTSVKLTGKDTADVAGNLTLHGVTKPVTLKVVHNKTSFDEFTKLYKTGFSATTTIKRSDFGITKGIPLVSDDVKIVIEVEGIREGVPPTSPTKETKK